MVVCYRVTNISALTHTSEHRRSPRWLQITGAVGCLVLVATLPWPTAAAGTGVFVLGRGDGRGSPDGLLDGDATLLAELNALGVPLTAIVEHDLYPPAPEVPPPIATPYPAVLQPLGLPLSR